jgi:hypothetical protein
VGLIVRNRFAHLHQVQIDLPPLPYSERLPFSRKAEAWCVVQFGTAGHDGVHGRWFRRGYYDYYFRDAQDAMMFKLAWGSSA